MHQAMAATLEHCVRTIRDVQQEARRTNAVTRLRWHEQQTLAEFLREAHIQFTASNWMSRTGDNNPIASSSRRVRRGRAG
jgi:hypothetical protein